MATLYQYYHHFARAWVKPPAETVAVIGGGVPATALSWDVDGLQWGASDYLTWG